MKAGTATASSRREIARRCVGQLGNSRTRSSVQLGDLLNIAPEAIDAALRPLVEARKLVSMIVQREGRTMFEYRVGAAWVPKDADFDICDGEGEAPVPSISPVPPRRAPAPRAARPAPVPPAAPSPRPAATPAAAEATAEPAGPAEPAPKPATGGPYTPGPQLVGYAPAELTLPAARVPSLKDWLRPSSILHDPAPPAGSAAMPAPQDELEAVIRCDDYAEPLCAINSRGQLTIELPNDQVLLLGHAQALAIKRFLDNTSVLEELAGRAAS